MALFQGCSKHTELKEMHIEGITYMRVNQFKNKYFTERYPKVIIADVFCGSGRNECQGVTVDGSPIRLLRGFTQAHKLPTLFPMETQYRFWFSDVNQMSCKMLESNINAFGEKIDGQKIDIKKMYASDAINELTEILTVDKDVFLYLLLDPNGPTDFPMNELINMLLLYSGRADVIPYISASAVKRVLAMGKKPKGWLGQIDNVDDGLFKALARGRDGWIRESIRGDKWQWTLIPTFGCMYPKNDWSKEGFHPIDSEIGKIIRSKYTNKRGEKR